jgi:nucleotidyltransferase substrate binding protein (TIGR01987 family)
MSLDLESFAKALFRLEEAWQLLKADPDNAIIRDAVIQRFEFSYELSWKMLKRYLQSTAANVAVFEGMSFQNLIRMGSDQGLLKSGWDVWWDYRDARAAISHTCDEEKAKMVLALMGDFIEEVQYLLKMLQSRGQA